MHRLPAFSARLVFSVRRFMEDNLRLSPPWPRCLLAVSGGADSTALLHILHALEVPLSVAHLDHGLRPESADEARQVVALAERLNLSCVVKRCDVTAFAAERKLGLEDAGRQCRYAMLERLRSEQGADWIVTGHHLDDLGEDVLLRLIRGSGWPALAGMPARDDERHLLRPLLHMPRQDLETLLRELHIPWCDDSSNQERKARRNRIRLDILPLIRAENPAFGDSVRRLWHLARADEDYWQAALGDAVPAPDGQGELFVEAARLDGLLPAARLRLYLACVRAVSAASGSGQARQQALLRLDELWRAKRSGAVIQMPGVQARISRQGIVFTATPADGR